MAGTWSANRRELGWVWLGVRIFLVTLVSLNGAVAYDCGPTELTSSHGSILSPSYPDAYPNNAACKWHIRLPYGQIATLSFVDFDIESSKDCLRDSLIIKPKGDQYCGSTLPPPFVSEEGDTLLITFTSGRNAVGRKGFRIDYVVGEKDAAHCQANSEFHCGSGNCIPLEWQCNGQRECSDGSDEHCQVTTPARTTAPLKCPAHFFLCQPVNPTMPHCLPETKKCDGHVDCANHEDENGCSCVHVMKEPHGYFASPNFPHSYDPNVDCTWHLAVGEGDVIQLRFDIFDLEEQYNTDYVRVYDGDNEMNEIGTYYGYPKHGQKNIYMPPTVIEGTGNQLMVVYHTDGSVPSNGFNATYQTKGVCLANQKQCSREDRNCYGPKEECDGRLTCIKGQDELGCSDACRSDQIPCFSSTKGCFTMQERCDGSRNCLGGEDEKNCDRSVCGYTAGLFLCRDGTCIEERYICDNSEDCQRGEDEDPDICPVNTNVVTAAAVGSIVCGLLLVAALSCTCKLYQLHVRERLPPSHMSPLRQIEEELLRREAPPSYTATMASPHFDEAQRAFIEGIQAAVIARNESRAPSSGRSSGGGGGGGGGRRQRGTFVRMLSRDNGHSGAVLPDESSQESRTETLPGSPAEADLTSTPSQEEEEVGNAIGSPPPPIPDVRPGPAGAYLQRAGAVAPAAAAASANRESTSGSVSDTDSETNHDALQLEARDQQILRAAANIRRMRLAGGLQNVMQAQDQRAARARSRTGSLVDQAATDSAPEEDSGPPTSDGGLESPPADASRTDPTGPSSPCSARRVSRSDCLGTAQPSSSGAEPRLDPPRDGQRSAPSSGEMQTGGARDRGEVGTRSDGEEDLSEEGASRSSSLLSLTSTSSQMSGEDVPILSTQ